MTNDRRVTWDVVDQASVDSFPASDPPGWGSYRAAPSQASIAEYGRSSARDDKARHVGVMVAITAVIVTAALVGWGFVRRAKHRDRSCAPKSIRRRA